MFFLVSVLFLKARGGTLAMNSLASHECLFFLPVISHYQFA